MDKLKWVLLAGIAAIAYMYSMKKGVKKAPDIYVSSTYLRLGDQGEDVKKLQRALNFLGYIAGPEDGIFGPQTEKAVVDFQMENQLVPDGIVGPNTMRALNTVLSKYGGSFKWEN